MKISRFKLTPEQYKKVEKIQVENLHKVVFASVGGRKKVNLDAVAITQDLEHVINRARQLRKHQSEHGSEGQAVSA